MPETIVTKRCSKCKENKSLLKFHREKIKRDGFKNHCKACCLQYAQRYRQTNRGKTTRKRHDQSEKGKTTRRRYNQSEKCKLQKKLYAQSEKGRKVQIAATKRFNLRHPDQFKARRAVNLAIKTGRLPRPDNLPCHYCPALAKQYHHHKGYEPEHWLEVLPVCTKCHGKFNRKTD